MAGGSAPEAIFLASPKAMVKVVAIGDRLPTGEKLPGVSAFATNNLGQIAFFAHSNGVKGSTGLGSARRCGLLS